MIDIIHYTSAIANINQGVKDINDIRGVPELSHECPVWISAPIGKILTIVEDPRTSNFLAAHTTIEFHPADGGKIVAVLAEKQVFKEIFGGILGGRFARTHHSVNFDLGLELIRGGIDPQGI